MLFPMTPKSSISGFSDSAQVKGPLRSLTDFPALPFSGREQKLNELHELFFQPFYEAAEQCDFKGVKGVRLSARAWRCASSIATLMIVSGRNESHAKYAEVAYDFFTRGYDVFCFDHRGQGFSQRELANTQVGWVESFQAYVNDLSTFHEQVVEPRRQGPLFILAHSMGAAVTSLWLSQSRVRPAAVVFSAPMVELILKPYPRVVVELMVNQALKSGREKEYILGGKNIELSTYGFDLTNCRARRDWNRELFRKYPQTQLGSPSFRWLHEALLMEKRLAHLEFPRFVQCPLLVWQAGEDQVVKSNFVQFAGQSQTSFIVAYEAKAQHELLQESDEIRQRVMCQTLAFLEGWKHSLGAD
jgi:lysophospholipase